MTCCSACGEHACACGCGAHALTPLPVYNRPGLDSLAWRVGTWADFRATMQAGLGAADVPALAGLRTREADDPALSLLDAWAVGADVLSFYQERIANEGYLRTATERRSVLELGRLLDYRLRPGVAASVHLAYTVEKDSPPVTLPPGARAQSIPAPGEQMQTFETAEALEARDAWNALKPRLTQPQVITQANLGTLDAIAFEGVANQLKPNDWLVFEFVDGSAPVALQVGTVTLDNLQQRTQVSLQGAPAVPAKSGGLRINQLATKAKAIASGKQSSPFETFVDALKQPPTLQPANALRLSRSVASALATGSDVRPQLLLNLQPRLAGTFYAAWSSTTAPIGSAQVSNVYVQRLAAARFGYNAVVPTKLVSDGGDPPVYQPKPAADWPLDTDGGESDNTLFLDNVYDVIVPGSYVVVRTPSKEGTSLQVRKVSAAAIHPRTAYGISGKTTQLTLAPSTGPAELTLLMDTTVKIDVLLRKQQVFAQSERLTLAGQTITDPVGNDAAVFTASPLTTDDATHLTLDGVVDGLKAGRWVIVEGQRADVPGTDAVTAAELVMLAAVEQHTDTTLPGDTLHSTLVFANAGLAYAYRRDSVTVYANVVRATHGETRNEVIGSGNGAVPMQAFVLKQPPLTWISAATPEGVQSTLSVRVNDLEWHETRNLATAGPADRRFATRTDDDGKTTVAFGDGQHGVRPATGVGNIKAVYRNGIGVAGNVRAGQVSLLATKPLGVKQVINPLRASGGADAETRDQARRNVPLAVLALDRLVSVRDYADFARNFGGVGKALAVKLGNRVQVTIAGAGNAPIDTSADLYRNLLQALRRYGDPALPLDLGVCRQLALTLSAQVGLAADYAWESVEPQVRAALLDAFGFERRALAQSIYLSEVVACIQAVRGVAWVDVDAFSALDEEALVRGLAGTAASDDSSEGVIVWSGVAAYRRLIDVVPAQPAELDDEGHLQPAQLLCLLPDVPDTLLLQEATR